MRKIKCILFDCMETLVDIKEIPTLREYALWAYEGSGVENYWRSFEEFFKDYIKSKEIIESKIYDNEEYDLLERFNLMAETKAKNYSLYDLKNVPQKLMDNYWKTYSEKCYVKEEVVKALNYLCKYYRLGVVSNFKVKNGVEQLLYNNKINKYFQHIITSINVGHRKPDDYIYKLALESFNITPMETLFVGDDYINDYEKPKKLGFNTMLLDRCNKFENVEERICDFHNLIINLNI